MSGAILIVGAGQAGLELACSLRDGGFGGRLTVVGDEAHPPYQRPPLSKAFLSGAASAASLELRAGHFYAERDIDLLLGDEVTDVQKSPDGSGVARCASGRAVSFDRLVLATGAEPRMLRLPGAEADGVVVLRTIADAEVLSAKLAAARSVAILGGGFIGLEVAATAQALGRRVTVVEAAPTLLGRAVGPLTAAEVLRHHRSSGVDVRLEAQVASVHTRNDRACGVDVIGAEPIAADLVVVGVGAAPRTRLAEQIGLEVDDGIVVDGTSAASDGVTLAIGDCATLPDPTPWGDSDHRVRLESVDHAVEHARTAAAHLLGAPRRHVSVPWFWSDQGTLKLQIVGLRGPADTAVVRRPGDTGRLVVGYYRDQRLVAVEAVNSPADFIAVRKILSAGVSVPKSTFADPAVGLRELARELVARPVRVA